RIADAQRMELGHIHRADGRFRLYLFAGRDESAFGELCDWLQASPDSPIVRTLPAPETDLDNLIDVRGILQRPHREVELRTLPSLLLPATGRYRLTDYEKVFSAVTRDSDFYDIRGIDREHGAAVVV